MYSLLIHSLNLIIIILSIHHNLLKNSLTIQRHEKRKWIKKNRKRLNLEKKWSSVIWRTWDCKWDEYQKKEDLTQNAASKLLSLSLSLISCEIILQQKLSIDSVFCHRNGKKKILTVIIFQQFHKCMYVLFTMWKIHTPHMRLSLSFILLHVQHENWKIFLLLSRVEWRRMWKMMWGSFSFSFSLMAIFMEIMVHKIGFYDDKRSWCVCRVVQIEDKIDSIYVI
jgi:hypothetical protein